MDLVAEFPPGADKLTVQHPNAPLVSSQAFPTVPFTIRRTEVTLAGTDPTAIVMLGDTNPNIDTISDYMVGSGSKQWDAPVGTQLVFDPATDILHFIWYTIP